MTIVDDTLRGLTLGDPDGPLRFIETLEREVPTYRDPREELIPEHARGKFKRLDYHVPFVLRGPFKLEDWPLQYVAKIAEPRTDIEGYVLCGGLNRDGGLCGRQAVNRCHFCPNHGGALHPADKKMSKDVLAPMPQDRIERMDRVVQFMQGFLQPHDLEDDEVQKGFIRNDQGQPVPAKKLGFKFEAQVAKELHSRLNRFLQSQTSDMLHVMVDIAKNDLYEAADRIKAAIWVSERTMGKTPDVVLQGTTTAPYASILESVESGSREDYRKSIQSTRPEVFGEKFGRSGDSEVVVEAEVLGESSGIEEVEDGRSSDELEDQGQHQVRVPRYSEERTSDDPRPAFSDRWGTDGSGEFAVSAKEDGSYTDSGSDHSVKARAEEIAQKRTTRLDQQKAIRKAKQRRFAARAVGSTSLDKHPWLFDFRKLRGTTKKQLKLIPPDQQTEAVVKRILEHRPPSDDDVRARQMAQADAEVDRLKAQMDKLKGT